MIRKTPAGRVDRSFAKGRIEIARAFLRAAQAEMALAEEPDIANPIVSQIVNAAIAYTDALTASFGERVNRQDHSAAVKTLRAALQKRLPTAQETRLGRILEEKDAAQYGSRVLKKSDAARLLRQIEKFATWAEAEIASRG